MIVAVPEGASSVVGARRKLLEVLVFRLIVRALSLAGAAATLCVLPLSAQDKPGKETKEPAVPQSAQPPAGLCRVWLENVPASQQPAATDCVTAIKNRPLNARVVFGNLRDEAAKAAPNGISQSAAQRTSGWPARSNGNPRRFDRSPGFPSRTNLNQTAGPNESRSVHTVNATVPAPRPTTPDSGRKVRRPER